MHKYACETHPQLYKEIGLQNWNTVLGLTDTEIILIGTIQESLEVQNHMTFQLQWIRTFIKF